MKKLLILAGVIALTATTQVFAQDAQEAKGACPMTRCEKQRPEFGPDRMHRPPHFDAKRLEEELNLTDEQKEQVKALRAKEAEEAKPLMDQLGEIHKKYKEEFKSILTEEQQKQLGEIKAKRQARHHLMQQKDIFNPPAQQQCQCKSKDKKTK